MVILGPVADIAMQKLTAEMPDQFEIAGETPDPLETSLMNRFTTGFLWGVGGESE